MIWKRQGITLLLYGWLILFAGRVNSFSQEPFFSILSTGSEINNATMQSVCQDKPGFLWLGTSNGLYRFDGVSFLRANLNDSLKDASFTAVFEDSSGTVWAGTSTGRILFIRDGKPQPFTPEEGLPAVRITGIVQDSRDYIWFSTYGEGVFCWTGKRLYNFDTDDGLGDNFTYTVVRGNTGNVWIGTDGGISVCSLINESKKVETIHEVNGLPDNIVLSLFAPPGNHIWAGMQDGGICKIDQMSHRVDTIPEVKKLITGPVNDLIVDGNKLWAALEDDGILEVDLKPPVRCRKIATINGKDYTKVRKVIRDVQKNTWFLSGSTLIRTTGDQLEFLSAEKNAGFANIKSIISSRNASLWFSNDNGLFRFRPGTVGNPAPDQFISSRSYPGIHIVSLYEDRDGFIWAGTFGNGLFRLNPETGIISQYTERDGLANNNVMSIAGTQNEIWFATLGGVSRCLVPVAGKDGHPRIAFEKFGENSGLGNNFIYSVFVDSKQRVWFATDGKGISVYENGRFTNFSGDTDVNSQIVYSIAQEQNGHIWFSSSNAGLFHYDGSSFRNFGQKDGLSDLAITGLSAASSPVIFIVHPSGIDVLEPLTEKFNYLSKEDGIGEINSNLNAVTADLVNDLVWIGTDKGIIKVSAGAFGSPLRPLIRLTGVKVFLSETDTLESHNFAHARNHFTFDFVGLWYKAPERVQYQVLLEGYDLDWIPTRNTSVVYSSLIPGKYTFRVRASLNHDYSDAAVASYHFVIRKPVWQTYWFIGISFVMAAAIIYLFIRLRERRLRREENLQKEKLLFQLQTLKNQVNPHFLFNSFSTLSAIIDEDKDMALDYVQKLSAFFRNILEFRDRSVISLREELELAGTYYYLQKKRFGVNFNLVIDISQELQDTFIPPMTLQMIIENAIKHNVISTDKPLTVKVKATHERIVITNTIRVKKSQQASTGVGLQNIRNRYHLLISREIEIDQSNGVFTVSLPVINTIPT